jgi:hypothetical protein
MNTEKQLADITHGIAAVTKDETDGSIFILHFCGYFEEPSLADFEDLRNELETNPEFGLVDMEFELILATDDMLKHVKEEENGID